MTLFPCSQKGCDAPIEGGSMWCEKHAKEARIRAHQRLQRKRRLQEGAATVALDGGPPFPKRTPADGGK